jgi:hypothetical protein
MKHWKSILGLLLIFIFGVITGGLITARVLDNRVRNFMQGGPDAVGKLIETRLTRELHLDRSQREGVVEVITNARVQISAARHEVQPKVDQVLAQAEQDIRGLLRPEQTAKFDRIVSRTKDRWK